jgi:hypothetical protein
MNAESFLDCLKNPSRIYQINYHELKSLVLQYPYCHNLRYLLVLKSHLEKHKDFDRNLKLAATYSLDRSFLYQLLNSHTPQEGDEASSIQAGGEFLELTGLGEEVEVGPSAGDPVPVDPLEGDLAFELGDTAPEKEQQPDYHGINEEGQGIKEEEPDIFDLVEAEEEPSPEDLESTEEELETVEDAPDELEKEIDSLFEDLNEEEVREEDNIPQLEKEKDSASTTLWAALNDYFPEGVILYQDYPAKVGQLVAAIAKSVAATLPARKEEELHQKKAMEKEKEAKGGEEVSSSHLPEPEPKSSFSSWLRQFEPPRVKVSLEEEPSAPKKKASAKMVEKKEPSSKNSKAKAIARQSVAEHEDIASETLAEILVRQGRIKKAIVMYKRLSLLIPEKSSFFAIRIEELNKQL